MSMKVPPEKCRTSWDLFDVCCFIEFHRPQYLLKSRCTVMLTRGDLSTQMKRYVLVHTRYDELHFSEHECCTSN